MKSNTTSESTSGDIRQSYLDGGRVELLSTSRRSAVPSGKQFILTVVDEIRMQRRTLYPGNFVLIDPEATPADGKMILVGDRLELWSGQSDISGVLIGTWIDDDGAEGSAS